VGYDLIPITFSVSMHCSGGLETVYKSRVLWCWSQQTDLCMSQHISQLKINQRHYFLLHPQKSLLSRLATSNYQNYSTCNLHLFLQFHESTVCRQTFQKSYFFTEFEMLLRKEFFW
jgi:hypothetical protein